MATNYTNFYYDVPRNGYDTSAWRTLYGAPGVGNSLTFKDTASIHFADVTKGDYTFNVTVPSTPANGDSRSFGLYQTSRGAYIIFNITGTTFSAKTSDGTNSSSSTITWDETAWSGVAVDYKIRWEAGTAKFYINGGIVATINDVSIPGVPLSLYIADSSASALAVNHIEAQGIQSYLLTVGPEDSTFKSQLLKAESVTTTEAVTMLITILYAAGSSESVTVSENVALTIV